MFLNYFVTESNQALRKDYEKSYKKFVNLSKKQDQLLRGKFICKLFSKSS